MQQQQQQKQCDCSGSSQKCFGWQAYRECICLLVLGRTLRYIAITNDMCYVSLHLQHTKHTTAAHSKIKPVVHTNGTIVDIDTKMCYVPPVELMRMNGKGG